MEIRDLKKGHRVFVYDGERPVELEVESIDIPMGEVWLSDGCCYAAADLHPTEYHCIPD